MSNPPDWVMDFAATLRSKKREERNVSGACYLCQKHNRNPDNEKNLYAVVTIGQKNYCIRCCHSHWETRPSRLCQEFTFHRITRIEWESLRAVEDVLNK